MGSALASGDVWDAKFPSVVIPYECMVDSKIRKNVNEKVAEILAWSMGVCATGRFPTTGPSGEELDAARAAKGGSPLCGEFKACYYGFRADGKARKETQEFPRSYMHSWICEKCFAQKRHKEWEPRMNYQNFSDAAAYRMTFLSALSYQNFGRVIPLQSLKSQGSSSIRPCKPR